MARRRQPPHLIWVADKIDKNTGKLRARGYWAIADGPTRISTGFGLEARAEAEKARLDYEVEQYSKKSASETINERGKGPRDVLVVDLIRFYLERHETDIQKKSKDKLRDYLNTVERFIKFWDGKTVFDINERTIKEYQEKARPGKPLADSTLLREFGVLRPMINFGVRKGRLEMRGHIIDWELPPPPPPREAFYSRAEVAALLWKAWRKRNMSMGRAGVGIPTSRHIARFILIAVWTGTRSEKIEKASYVDYDDRPWMDLDSRIFYRGGVSNKSPTNKKADPVKIPDELIHHLKRWREKNPGTDNVIDHHGEAGSVKGAFRRLKHEVLSSERAKKCNRHTFKHTCASWLMQKRVPMAIIAKYLSTTEEVIDRVYGHFSPDFHEEVNTALKLAKQERLSRTVKERREKKEKLQKIAV
jgi:integrase